MTLLHNATVVSKLCSKCGATHPLTYFYKKKTSRDGLEGVCKGCKNKQAAASASRNKEKRKFVYIKCAYGITEEEYYALLDKQGGHCACCPQTENLVVDHCHTTGAVRGLLCPRCNHGLGHFRDNTEYLQNAIAYLENNEPLRKTTTKKEEVVTCTDHSWQAK